MGNLEHLGTGHLPFTNTNHLSSTLKHSHRGKEEERERERERETFIDNQAQPTQERMQGLRGRLHLRAQPSVEQVRGLRGRLHLRPPPREEPMQGLQATQGELAAAGWQL